MQILKKWILKYLRWVDKPFSCFLPEKLTLYLNVPFILHSFNDTTKTCTHPPQPQTEIRQNNVIMYQKKVDGQADGHQSGITAGTENVYRWKLFEYSISEELFLFLCFWGCFYLGTLEVSGLGIKRQQIIDNSDWLELRIYVHIYQIYQTNLSLSNSLYHFIIVCFNFLTDFFRFLFNIVTWTSNIREYNLSE